MSVRRSDASNGKVDVEGLKIAGGRTNKGGAQSRYRYEKNGGGGGVITV